MKDYAKKFYTGRAWQQCRDGYINSVDGLCEECSRQGIVNPGWIVHHKIHLTPQNIHDPEITLNWDNLEFLCQSCHNKVHKTKQDNVVDGLSFDKDGNLIQI